MLEDLFKVSHHLVLLLNDLLETDNKRKKKRLKVKYLYNKIKEEVI
jgi:hypothetical protein